MKYLLCALIGLMLTAGLIAAEPTTMPAAPTTKPASGTITGRVEIQHGWSVSKPDLTRVIVYVADEPDLADEPEPTGHVTIAQKNKAFIPNFAVVRRNTTIEFPNWDDFDHNVFSLSKAAPAFDLDRYPKGQSKSRKFDKCGVVQLFCNIHPQMRAIVYVVPNHCFARADANGQFTITDVPPGPHRVVAWQERCLESTSQVQLDVNQMLDCGTIKLQTARRDVTASEQPPGDDYGVDRGLGVKREQLDAPVVGDAHPAPDPEPTGH